MKLHEFDEIDIKCRILVEIDPDEYMPPPLKSAASYVAGSPLFEASAAAVSASPSAASDEHGLWWPTTEARDVALEAARMALVGK